MRKNRRSYGCLLVFAWCCSCLAPAQSAVTLSQSDVQDLCRTLESMRQSLAVLRQSLTASDRELQALKAESVRLENSLNKAAAALRQSESELCALQTDSRELGQLLNQSKEAYEKLSAYCAALERKNTLLKWAAGGTAALAAGCVIAAACILFVR